MRRREDGIMMQGKHIYWSPTMISQLKRWFPTTRNKDLGDTFGISPSVVRRKAYDLGLKKDPEAVNRWLKENRMLSYVSMRQSGNKGWFQNGHEYHRHEISKNE